MCRLAEIELVQSVIRSPPLRKTKESFAFVPESCLTETIPCSADPSYMKQNLLRLVISAYGGSDEPRAGIMYSRADVMAASF